MITLRHLLWLGLGSLSLAQEILLPKGQGPYDVTIRTSQLDDFNRTEIFSNKTEHRRLMISVFSPIVTKEDRGPYSSPCQSQYMPPEVSSVLTTFYKTAPPPSNFTIDFSRLWLPSCALDVTYGLGSHNDSNTSPRYNFRHRQAPPPRDRFPLVLFGPGLGFSRLVYSVLCSFLASHGFIVVSVDHPYDALLVQFPDGTYTSFSTQVADSLPHVELDLVVRTKDVSFVLDQLSTNATLSRLLYAPGVRPCSLDKVGIWGHSFGGATAVSILLQDKRFKAGINVDGTVFGPAPSKGLDSPLVLWQSELGDDGTPHNETDSTWAELWTNLRGYKRHLQMQGAQHAGLSDYKLLADLLGTSVPRFGTIDGLLELQTLAVYARDFFNFALEDRQEGLLEGPSEEYPEVVFLR